MGLKQGREVAVQKVARNMLKKGFRLSQIAELTGLTEEEIEELD